MATNERIISFDALYRSTRHIDTTIYAEEMDMDNKFRNVAVIETTADGSKRDAMIMRVKWNNESGKYELYIAYTDEKSFIGGSWVTSEVLTLAGGE